jgi:uncharacterized delta-60 repeat protein
VRRVLLAAVGLAALAHAAPAQALVGGAVDSRFADCGQATGLVPRAIANRQFSYGAGSDLARQPDGRIVAAGPAARGMGATRFNPDGSLDASFGGDGVAFIAIDGDRGDQTGVAAVAVQPDGKVVAAGWRRSEEGDRLVERFVIARFLPDGTADPSFSGDGIVVESPPGATDATAHGIAVAPGGGLLVAAQVDERFAVARYRDDGTLDPAFGEAGVGRVGNTTPTNGWAEDVFARPDGRIVAAGQTGASPNDQGFTVARLTAGGAPDPTFAGTGVLVETFDESSFASPLVPLPDGRFYAVGTTSDFWGDDEGGGTTRRAALVRYLEDGERDDSFAGDGSVLDALGQGLYAAISPAAAAADADGRLAIAVEHGPVARYAADGTRDAGFGLGGRLRIFSAPTGDSLLALPDGALLVGGGNARQGFRPAGFEWGPAILRLGAGGQALESLRGQPGACYLRVRNPTLPHLLRRGRTARNGKLLVGMFLTQPGDGIVRAEATAGGRTFDLAAAALHADHAGSTAIEAKVYSAAARRLRRASAARIRVTVVWDDTDVVQAVAARTLRR